ncbi:putative enzyme related to lactoylglutathione lyase [Bradyrhizobium diazoefficiens]
MATLEIDREAGTRPSPSRSVDLKLEVVVIPVSDVDRAKAFYMRLGWRLDADFSSGDDWRVIQFTPPGSACSVIFGRNVTAAAPGSVRGLYLIVSDLEAARQDLLGRGIAVSEPFHGGGATFMPGRTNHTCSAVSGSAVLTRSAAATAPSPRSAIPTAMAGCSRRSPHDCPDASPQTARISPRRPIWRRHCAARRWRMASMRSEPADTTTTGRTGTPTTSCASRPVSRCRPEVAASSIHGVR